VCALLAAFYLGAWAYLLAGDGLVDPFGRALGSDFAAFYGVSRALLDGVPARSLYSPELLNDVIRPFTNEGKYIWLYPPIAFLPYWPLGLLPYLTALAAWVAGGIAACLAVVWRVVPGRAALAIAATFPAVFMTSTHGQNGFLVAACIGLGLVLLPTRPIAAGLLFGVVSIKPHLGFLIPIALVSGRHWRGLAATAASGAALSATVTLAFGLEAWRGFFESSALARQMLETGSVPYARISSVFSAVRLLGGTVGLAYALQGAAAAGATVVLAWMWAKPCRHELRAATLTVASLVATPYAYDYDFVVLGIGLAFFARIGLREGWLDWEKTALAAAWAMPLFARALAGSFHLPAVPLVLAFVLALTVRRAFRERQRHDAHAPAPGSLVRALGT
jgi:hypothetical protein